MSLMCFPTSGRRQSSLACRLHHLHRPGNSMGPVCPYFSPLPTPIHSVPAARVRFVIKNIYYKMCHLNHFHVYNSAVLLCLFTWLCNSSLELFHLANLKPYTHQTTPHFSLPQALGNHRSTFCFCELL